MISLQNKLLNDAVIKKAIIAASLFFVCMCLFHYFSQRPLWEDEIYVYNNIKSHDFAELFGVLDHTQSFPRVYLVIIKFFAEFFNLHALALRFLPLIMMLAAFFIWLKLYRHSLKDSHLVFLAVLSFACGYRLIYYAGELKPYSMDVLVVALFSLFFLRQKTYEFKSLKLSDYFIIAGLPFLIFFFVRRDFCFLDRNVQFIYFIF
ncbi:hypothetical protein KAH94_00895 [bacterium]|nr:hypothetical protein [bacterium]